MDLVAPLAKECPMTIDHSDDEMEHSLKNGRWIASGKYPPPPVGGFELLICSSLISWLFKTNWQSKKNGGSEELLPLAAK